MIKNQGRAGTGISISVQAAHSAYYFRTIEDYPFRPEKEVPHAV